MANEERVPFPTRPGWWICYSPEGKKYAKKPLEFVVSDGAAHHSVKGELGAWMGSSHWWPRRGFELNCPGTLWEPWDADKE